MVQHHQGLLVLVKQHLSKCLLESFLKLSKVSPLQPVLLVLKKLVEIIRETIGPYMRGRRGALILDCVRSHTKKIVKEDRLLIKTNGWKAGGDYHQGSANFDAMREWNRSEIYRQTIAYFADKLIGR